MSSYRVIRLTFALIMLGATSYVGARRMGQLPPLGSFLDPAHGIWAVARAAEMPSESQGEIDVLGESVRVVYDRRGVPHIWAATTDDAVRALGYVVARDRLFQMELQARAAAGRLTEWFGERALEVDRQQRSIGLPWSAESNLAQADTNSEAVRLGRLYAEGVNSWLDGMRSSDLPFEYKLLDVEPELWNELNGILTFKRMGYTLAYDTHDRRRTQIERLIGREATDALFPINSPIQEPIQPARRSEPRFDYQTLPPPAERERESPNEVVARAPTPSNTLRSLPPLPLLQPSASGRLGSEVGSNNWAVSPSRSASGNALLSGDPHLNLTLPSIWYEVHIKVPDEVDVYGVTIPGIPGVVIGFNRDIAWSFTNTGADVLDYYRETLDRDAAPTRYMLDGEWRELDQRIEIFEGIDGDTLAVDTLYATHRGPLLFSDQGVLSMRWTVLEEMGSVGALTGAASATSVAEFQEAMETYYAPAQNMIVADRAGNIAIRSTGRFPIRPDNGDGTVIRDGTSSASDWLGYWPLDEYPGAINPSQGYLASANQQPVDPLASDRYLGVNWPTPWRALRINELLRNNSSVTQEEMAGYQTDPGNAKADLFVPAFLEAAERALAFGPDELLAEAAHVLSEWDRRYTKGNRHAVLFESAMHVLTDRVWDELVPRGSGQRVATPGQSILATLLRDPDSPWWDHAATAEVVETRDEILVTSLVDAFEQLTEDHGVPDGDGWKWENNRHNNVMHLLGFPALSALDLPVQGGPGNLNPSSGQGTHGASWRMVVELGDRVYARVTYPGGQSGNLVSSLYDNRIRQWVDGVLEEVFFPTNPEDLDPEDMLSALVLERGGYRDE